MHIHNRLPSVSKYRFLVCFVFVSATLQYSCNPGEEQEPLTFPSAYQYQELEFQTTKYYVLTTNSYNEIAASGNYLEFDNILKDILEINSTEFEIEKLELLDDQTVKVSFFDYLNIAPSDTILPYTLDDNKVSISFGTATINYVLDTDNSNIRLPLLTLHHSWRTSATEVEYSPMDVSFELPGGAASQIDQLRNQYNLQAGDTIAINNSYYKYSKQ